MLELLQSITISRASQSYTPLFRWTITDGLQRIDISLEPQAINAQPTDVLKHIRAVSKPGIYVLLDFHPFLDDPYMCACSRTFASARQKSTGRSCLSVTLSRFHRNSKSFCARFDMALPSESDRATIVKQAANEYAKDNPGARVKVDPKAHELFLQESRGT